MNMKRLLKALLLVAVTLSMASCDSSKGKKASKSEEPAYKAYEVRVYSNAYDGFVNVREAPTTKSAILGKLRNGEDYLVQVAVEGNWIAVQWHGMIGYVNKSMVGNNPWNPVYHEVSADEIAGWYYFDSDDVLIFNNGKFARVGGSEYGYVEYEYGTWKFEGTEIVLKTKFVTEAGRGWGGHHVGRELRYAVSAKWKSMSAGKRTWDYDKVYFRECKKFANQYARHK